MVSLEHELDEAEAKAWESLARYKFQMFGYWAAIWVHLNRIGGFKRRNPWKSLVHNARQRNADVQTRTNETVVAKRKDRQTPLPLAGSAK